MGLSGITIASPDNPNKKGPKDIYPWGLLRGAVAGF
jgi:hypothetical protein